MEGDRNYWMSFFNKRLSTYPFTCPTIEISTKDSKVKWRGQNDVFKANNYAELLKIAIYVIILLTTSMNLQQPQRQECPGRVLNTKALKKTQQELNDTAIQLE